MKQVAIVICNYNKQQYVVDCIESVFQSNFREFDLIVVDNASTDDSVAEIRARFGDRLTLLVNEENTGGSGGFNRGIQYAMESGDYAYIHLLDNDVRVDADAIGNLYAFMESHPEAGACGSLILQMDYPTTIQDFGAMVDIKNLGAKPILNGMQVQEDMPEYVACDYVAACSALFRRSAIEQVGCMDEDHFIYWDDIAFSWKLRRAGYKIYALKTSKIWHKVGGTGRNSSWHIYYFFRNKIRTFVQFLSDEEYVLLPESVTRRMFRTFVVNLKSKTANYTYLHALNDVLNDIRGKGEAFKIPQQSDPEFEFEEKLKASRSLLILCDDEFRNMGALVRDIRSYHAGIQISIVPGKEDLSYLEDVELVQGTVLPENYDLTLKLCYHILDIEEYDHSLIYMDVYHNQIACEEDFEWIESCEQHYAFYHTVWYPFIKSKLDALRVQYGHALPEDYR